MSTAISSNKFDILRSDDENERNYEEQAGGGGGGGVVAKYVSLEKLIRMGHNNKSCRSLNSEQL